MVSMIGLFLKNVFNNGPKDRNVPPETTPIPVPIATQVPSQCDMPNRSQLYFLNDTIIQTTKRTKL